MPWHLRQRGNDRLVTASGVAPDGGPTEHRRTQHDDVMAGEALGELPGAWPSPAWTE